MGTQQESLHAVQVNTEEGIWDNAIKQGGSWDISHRFVGKKLSPYFCFIVET